MVCSSHYQSGVVSACICLFVVCLCILHQSCLTVTAGGIGFQSTAPLERAGVFNLLEGDSPQNTEPLFIA